MRILIVVVAVILVASLIGWISFSADADHTSINLETTAIRDDTDRALQTGADLLKRAGNKVESEVASE